jgi:hypothetical protein
MQFRCFLRHFKAKSVPIGDTRAEAKRRKSSRALQRQEAFREADLQTRVPEFFEEPSYPTISNRLRRTEVLASCFSVSAVMTTIGVTGCVLVPLAAKSLGISLPGFALETVQNTPSLQDALFAVAVGLAVTCARQVLIVLWPMLKESNDAANSLVCLSLRHSSHYTFGL